jgi:hypothetical protein
MKTFGTIKTKIEDKLTDSYKKNTFKKELKKFKTLVLEDKNVVQIYHIYDNLSKPQGYSEETSKLFLDEAINMVKKSIEKTDFKKLNEWISDVKSENRYSHIDMIVEGKVQQIESIINSKKLIIENLQKKQDKKEVINLPLKTMLGVANKALNSIVSNLNEEEKKELTHIISLSENDIKIQFSDLKESTIKKLESLLLEQTDVELVNKIQDTITKIKDETPGSLSLYKLLTLNKTF